MENTKIKNGFYWIRYKFKWIIGERIDGTWFFCGNGKGFGNEYVDEIGDYIGSGWDDPRYKEANCAIFDVSKSWLKQVNDRMEELSTIVRRIEKRIR